MQYQKVAMGSLDIESAELTIGGVLGFENDAGQPSDAELQYWKKRMVVVEQLDSFGLPLIDTVTGIRKASYILLVGPQGTGRNDRHKYIPSAHGHSTRSIRGGGYCTLDARTVRLEGSSVDFGSVPAVLRQKWGVLLTEYFRSIGVDIAPEEAFLNAEESPYIDRYTAYHWLRFRQVLEAADQSEIRPFLPRLKSEYQWNEEFVEREINSVYNV